MTFFVVKPYPCGCEPFVLCKRHQAFADEQRREFIKQRCLAESIKPGLDELAELKRREHRA